MATPIYKVFYVAGCHAAALYQAVSKAEKPFAHKYKCPDRQGWQPMLTYSDGDRVRRLYCGSNGKGGADEKTPPTRG